MIKFRGTILASAAPQGSELQREAMAISAIHSIDPAMVRQIEVTDTLITFVMDDEGGTVIKLPPEAMKGAEAVRKSYTDAGIHRIIVVVLNDGRWMYAFTFAAEPGIAIEIGTYDKNSPAVGFMTTIMDFVNEAMA